MHVNYCVVYTLCLLLIDVNHYYGIILFSFFFFWLQGGPKPEAKTYTRVVLGNEIPTASAKSREDTLGGGYSKIWFPKASS